MIGENLQNKYQDFYNYLLLAREVRQSTATYNVQKINVLLRQIDTFSKVNLESLFVRLKGEGKNNNYINTLRDVARVYCDYLQYKGLEVDESIYSIKKLKEVASVRATLSDSEIEAFLNLPAPASRVHNQYTKELWDCQTSKKGYDIWTIFFSIMAYTGMRPQEVALLTTDLVDFGRGVFIVTEENSKTHSERFVPIPPNIKVKLEDHVKGLKGSYLFPAKSGKSYRFQKPVVDNVDWGYNFHTRIKRLGIKRKGLVPYSLRHSLITRLLEEDVNIFKVQKIVGHRRLETTARYTHMTTKDIQLAIAKHPLIRKATDPMQILDAFKEVVRGFEFDKNNKFSFSLQEGNGEVNVQIKIC